ncbi:MAG: 50S ribosomal protein L23 [Bacteroidales bacterium]
MNIIIKPIITEKMTAISEKMNNRYGFIVDKRADKLQIRRAVEEIYEVEVDQVNTMNYSGKSKSRYTKTGILTGKTKAFKKAIITLAEGQTIDFFSNI